jgi:hypothetical protein
MRNRLSKLHYLMFFLSMAAMTGCGANNAGTSASLNSSAAGGVAAKLQWQSGAAGSAKTQARALSSTMPTGIANIQFTVTGSGANGAIPVVKTTIPASGTGAVNGIYPGTVAVAVKAVDTVNNVTYEGYAVNVDINAGKTTDVGTITMTLANNRTDEATCVGCHETALDATGQSIVANYKALGSDGFVSSHYQGLVGADGTTAGCVGCHGSSHNTPDPSAVGTTRTGSATTGIASTRCYDCHVGGGRFSTTVVSNHDTYYTVNSTACAACHSMHNSKAAVMERETWSESRHGADDYAHIQGGASGCATRCHNPKGFIAAVATPGAVIQGTIVAADQMITCDACHTNAAMGRLRYLPGTKQTAFATYTSSTPGYQFAPNNNLNPNKKKYYPDVAGSNLCVICHSGTTEGTSTPIASKGSDPYFANYTANRSLVKPHNMPAAAVMYVKFGFTNLSTGTAGVPTASYLAGLTSDLDGGSVTSTHRKFGTSAIASDSHFSATNPAPSTFLVNGPCAVCHVTGSHSFKIDQAAITAVCNHCHTSENGNSITSISSFQANFLDPQQEVYNNAIALGATFVNQKIAAYNAANPSTPIDAWVRQNGEFRVDTPTVVCPQKMKLVVTKYDAVQNSDGTWPSTTVTLPQLAVALGYSTTGSDLGRVKFVGALSNLCFFSQDQGGFAHARTYSRRLIYDSLNYLANGNLSSNTTLAAKAVALSGITSFNANGSGLTIANPVAGLYTKGTNAYNAAGGTITTPYSGTFESMLFLIGWSRSTGAWSAPERP